MSFSLLAPALLGLAVLAAGPVLAHMALRRPTERRAFGATMLLQRLQKRLRRRRVVQDVLLLLLRVLAVLLIVAAVARPRLYTAGSTTGLGSRGAVVFLVDDSLSMGLVQDGSQLAVQARQRVLQLLDSLPPGTRIGLVRLGGSARSVLPALVDDPGQVRAALQSLEAGYGGTDLAGGLLQARSLLSEGEGEIVVVSDEAGPGLARSATAELERVAARGLGLVPVPLRANPPRNLVVLAAEYGEGLEGGTVRVVVANYGPDLREGALTLTLPGPAVIQAFVDVPAGGRAEERFTVPPEVPGGVASVRVQDDALVLDDTRYFHVPRVGASRVMVVDGAPGSTPVRSEVYFLERALAPWAEARGGLLPDVVAPAGLAHLDPARHRVVFLANVDDPGPHASKLLPFVQRGGGVVIGLGSNVTADAYNAALQDLLPAPLRKVRDLVDVTDAAGVPLTAPDVDVALFKPFRRGGRGGFARATARRAFTLEPEAASPDTTTLLSWSNGLPALLERRVGRGRVLLWTSTLDMDWTDLPAQAVYVPFVQRLVTWLGGEAGGDQARLEALVGEPVRVTLPELVQEPVVRGPDGEPRSATVDRGGQASLVFTPERPGAYVVALEGEPPLAWVAVNTPPTESDVRVDETLAQVEAAVDAEALLQVTELGRFALWAGLALLALQAALAALLGSRQEERVVQGGEHAAA